MKTNKLKQFKIVGLDISTFKTVTFIVSAFCRKDAVNLAYDHFHMLFPKVQEV